MKKDRYVTMSAQSSDFVDTTEKPKTGELVIACCTKGPSRLMKAIPPLEVWDRREGRAARVLWGALCQTHDVDPTNQTFKVIVPYGGEK